MSYKSSVFTNINKTAGDSLQNFLQEQKTNMLNILKDNQAGIENIFTSKYIKSYSLFGFYITGTTIGAAINFIIDADDNLIKDLGEQLTDLLNKDVNVYTKATLEELHPKDFEELIKKAIPLSDLIDPPTNCPTNK